MKRVNVICDKCGIDFPVIPTETRCEEDGKVLVGKAVTVRAFQCPYCKKIYITSVMTDEMKEELKNKLSREEIRRLQRREEKLRKKYIRELERLGGKYEDQEAAGAEKEY